jgi:hypothetical protein
LTDWLETGLVCAALIWAGWPWARSIPAADPGVMASVALAYLTGTALVSLAMLGVAIVGLPLDRLTLLLCFVVVRSLRSSNPSLPRSVRYPGMTTRTTYALVAVAVLTVGFGLIEALRLGSIESTDFLKAWGLKGVAVAVDHNLDFDHISSPNLFYPLEVSNVNGAVLIAIGHLTDSVLRVPAALYGLSLVGVTWWLLRLMMPPTAAAAAVALAVLTPEFSRQMTSGLADLALASYVTICVLAAYLWLLDGGDRWASLSGFAAGAAAWTKLEGAFTCLVILATVVIVRRAVRTPGITAWLCWFALFVVPWQVFRRLHHIPANRSHFNSLHVNIPWIVRHVSGTLAETAHWGVFWPLCLTVILVTSPLWWSTPTRWLAALTLPNAAWTLLAYVTHYRGDQAGSVEATAHRLYLHLAPSVAVLTVMCVLTATTAAAESHSVRVAPGP